MMKRTEIASPLPHHDMSAKDERSTAGADELQARIWQISEREAKVAAREAALSAREKALQEVTFPAAAEQRIRELESFVEQLREVNQNLLSAKLKMSHLAHHDFLTNLPNRVQLLERLTQAMTLALRKKRRLAVIFLDIDHFKNINDTLGHAIGDQLLQSVAQRLLASVRTSDTVSRLGGDEFLILLSEIEQEDDATRVANKIISALAAPHFLHRQAVHITASIGISVFPSDGVQAERLIRHADTAMYHAKKNGRNQYQFFRQEMNRLAVERQTMEKNLRHALEQQQFLLHYHAKVDLESGAVTGVEALLRWQHPERGMLYPEQFMQIARDCGLIVSIGEWTLREACRQARCWLDAGQVFERMAVNISAPELHQNLPQRVHAILAETGLEARHLALEMQESVLMENVCATTALLQQLKALDVQLVIDDFGTGNSVLRFLRDLPIDALKIDRAFMQDISSNPAGALIVGAVISVGNSLRHQVIAEGVETAEQVCFLKAHHCREAQGFYFSQPVAAEAFSFSSRH